MTTQPILTQDMLSRARNIRNKNTPKLYVLCYWDNQVRVVTDYWIESLGGQYVLGVSQKHQDAILKLKVNGVYIVSKGLSLRFWRIE